MTRVEDMQPNRTLSVVGEACPLNYVRTKLLLEDMGEGEVLAVFLSPGEAERNVPRSAAEDGHEVLEISPAEVDRVRVLIRKRENRIGS